MASTIDVLYRVRCPRVAIVARAEAIAVEQSVEMPPAIITDAFVREKILGRVVAIEAIDEDLFDVRVALAAATVGDDPGQLLNMVFGNTSLQEDVVLAEVALPDDLAARFGGPNHGLAGLRARVGAAGRAMSASALKPQGLPPQRLADLAEHLALGGLDYVKDDHGLAGQSYAPFDARVAACAAAVGRACARTGHPTRYVPSLYGHLDDLRRQLASARAAGLDTVLVAPMIMGLSTFRAIVGEFPDFAFLAHPTMAGAARIAPSVIAAMFRWIGADGVIFPNYGGRFGYSAATCRAIAAAARTPGGALRPAVPIPAGGMSLERVAEMLDFYGDDTMLLIGGSLLAAPPDGLAAAAEDFARLVRDHRRR